MSLTRHHTDWLNLLEVSGPFLSVSVLRDAFPQELDAHDPHAYAQLKLAYDEWLDGRKTSEIHHAWIDFVLSETLELRDVLLRGQDIPSGLEANVDLHGETLRPDAIVTRTNGKVSKPALLICEYPSSQKLGGSLSDKRWSASPATRMMELLHRTENSLGLVTNGEEWMVVHAKSGEVTGFGSWYAELLTEERIALRSFRSLLGLQRFFGVPDNETFRGLLERSREDQKEVTDQLGRQVRHAVETLISSLDWVDRDQNRQLLADYDEKKLYEAALTVMMRLVFLLCAEERGLLLLGKNDLYDQHYAVSPLRDQLREEADQFGEEILESRYDAWSRLLSTFRAVHAGVAHEELHLPAYGGSLFDPDRFPFLEGRDAYTNWKEEPASPLPINNRTVLELLESLQLLEVRVGKSRTREAQRLSFRALDIEQIGHVYEGLLDHTAVRADSPVLGLQGAKDLEPEVPLYALEDARSEDRLLSFLKETTKRTPKSLEKGLGLYETIESPKLPLVCDNDAELVDRVRPYIGLVRESSRGMPTVFTKGSVYVTQGSDRRSTGTHYTPRSLTEEIVQHALDPLVYEGMANGVEPGPKTLKTADEILGLKVCDLAMGSGAFLVQACRYLSEKVVEAWEKDKPDVDKSGEHREELLARARRLVVEKCLYGVDKNPLAVEMAKLSLWLITLDAKKPFSFLDHALRCGDSLLGVTDRNQILYFHPNPDAQSKPVIDYAILAKLDQAERLRNEIEGFTVDGPRDGERKRELLSCADQLTSTLKLAGDLLAGATLASDGTPSEGRLAATMPFVLDALEGEPERARQSAEELLACASLDSSKPQRPFHWPLEFPEVFSSAPCGFHSIIGNPPFKRGKGITGILGQNYREMLVEAVAGGHRGSADLCTYFLLRAATLTRKLGTIGFITTNTISEGDTREVGLGCLCQSGHAIYRAVPSQKWPGEASLEVAQVWLSEGGGASRRSLAGKEVDEITSYLTARGASVGQPRRLAANSGYSFIGSYPLGSGFTMTPQEAKKLIEKDKRNGEVLRPYINGKDLNSSASQTASRWIIDFRDWPLERALTYPDCLDILREKVLPERAKKAKNVATWPWWRYWRPRGELYSAVRDLARVFGRSLTSKHHCVTSLPSGYVYDQTIPVFAFEDFARFAVIQSSIHQVWALMYGASLETRPRYTPSDCFETFPFPTKVAGLEEIGTNYHEFRARLMLDSDEGLTKTYNRFHARADLSNAIVDLRSLHERMDTKVISAYGWTDISLGHGFHETKQGLRYTISDAAKQEVLDRLLALNHERYAEESAQGLHDKKRAKKRKTKKKSKPASRKKQPVGQGELF